MIEFLPRKATTSTIFETEGRTAHANFLENPITREDPTKAKT